MADESYPRTQTLLTGTALGNDIGGQGGNKTGVSLSTMILIQVGDRPVGAIQEINISERRNIKKVAEVGTDGLVDSAPQNATEITGGCTRVRMDKMRMAEAFGRGYIHLHSQRIPFDITITDYFGAPGPSGGPDLTIVTTIKNVWMTSLGYSYSASDYIITDKMDWTAEAIYSQLINGTLNAATGGLRNQPLYADVIEREADVGLLRGAMDAKGLLNAVYTTW